VQHATDDKDNFLLAFDGKWRITKGAKVYFEALFDDITVGKLFSSSGGNKSAYTVGTQLIPPGEIGHHFAMNAEYTKIRPFVYSHIFATNVYTNWYSPLGYTKEPNSEFMTVELEGTFFPLQITVHASRQNHGANLDTSQANWNVGGDIYYPHYLGAKKDFPFLDGHLIKTDRIGIRASYELLENFAIYGEIMNIKQTGTSSRTEKSIGFRWNV
jgi:hypothetical protein